MRRIRTPGSEHITVMEEQIPSGCIIAFKVISQQSHKSQI